MRPFLGLFVLVISAGCGGSSTDAPSGDPIDGGGSPDARSDTTTSDTSTDSAGPTCSGSTPTPITNHQWSFAYPVSDSHLNVAAAHPDGGTVVGGLYRIGENASSI